MKMLPAQSHISVYYNLDNGSGKIRGIWAQNNAGAKSIFEEWIVPFKDLGATTVSLHNTGSTDHEPFDAIGIPAFQFIQDPICLLYTSPSPRDGLLSRMPSSA